MKIIIEETISQEFELPFGTTIEDVKALYRNGDLVVDNGNLVCTNVSMGEDEAWVEI